MNLVESAKMAMSLSDQQLQQSLRGGSLPQFVVAAEMTRRKKTRESMPGPQSTVVQELMANANAQMPAPQPQPPMQQPMWRGGVVGLAEGGPVQQPVDPNYYLSKLLPAPQIAVTPPPSSATEDYLSMMLPEIAKRKAKITDSEKNRLNRALMQAGFAMMASKSPRLMGGIGEGAMAGLGYHEADRANQEAGLMALLNEEQRVRSGQQGAAENKARRDVDIYEKGVGRDIVAGQLASGPVSTANHAAIQAMENNARLLNQQPKQAAMPSFNENQLRYAAKLGDPIAASVVKDLDAADARKAAGSGQRPAQFTPAQKIAINNKKTRDLRDAEEKVRRSVRLLKSGYNALTSKDKPPDFASEQEAYEWLLAQKQRIQDEYEESIGAATGDATPHFQYPEAGIQSQARASAPAAQKPKLKYNPATGKVE